jgi:hypothetical protein
MGLTHSNPTVLDIEHNNMVITQCEQNKSNRAFMLNLLKTEWTSLIEKWNQGILSGYHFKSTSCVIGTINNQNLNQVYRNLITKWNKGESTSSDYNNVTNCIIKISIK